MNINKNYNLLMASSYQMPESRINEGQNGNRTNFDHNLNLKYNTRKGREMTCGEV